VKQLSREYKGEVELGYAESGTWKEDRRIMCSGRDGSPVEMEKIICRTDSESWEYQ
jgi:hypothetical protein